MVGAAMAQAPRENCCTPMQWEGFDDAVAGIAGKDGKDAMLVNIYFIDVNCLLLVVKSTNWVYIKQLKNTVGKNDMIEIIIRKVFCVIHMFNS